MMRTHGITHFLPDKCFGCKLTTLQLAPPTFVPHFNWAVGQHVRSQQELNDALKTCAERNSIATGAEHSYELREPGDLKPIREADQVLDDRARNITKLTGVAVSYD